jgi:hypothetical protein
MQFNEAFFKNCAVPGGMLTMGPSATDEQFEQFKEFFRDEYRGALRAFKTGILQEGVASFTPHDISHQDMHFDVLRHMNREEIAGVLKVPPSIMGWKEQTHKATAEKELRDWLSGPVMGLCSVIVDSLLAQVFIPKDDAFTWLEWDFSDVPGLQEDEGERVDRANIMKSWGVPTSQLEAKYRFGIEEYDGWDVPMVPLNQIPLEVILSRGLDALQEEPEEKPEEEPEESEEESEEEEAETPEEEEEEEEPPDEGKKKKKEKEAATKKTLAQTTDAETRYTQQHQPLSEPPLLSTCELAIRDHTPSEIVLWEQWISKTVPSEVAFNGVITDYLMKANRWIERSLSSAAKPEDMIADILDEAPRSWLELPASFDQNLKLTARRLYHKIAKEVGPIIEQHIQAANIPFNFDINHYRLTNFLQVKEIKVVLHVNHEGFREKVRRAVEEALRREHTVGQLQEVLFGKLNEEGLREGGFFSERATQARALRIARTETAQTANGLEFESEKIAGVKEHQWLASRDMHVRESHLANMALGPYPITATFPNGCRYPGDLSALPEETVNCRCSLIPVS